MDASKKQREDLKRKIIEAFDKVPYPKEIFGTLYERDEGSGVREAFANENWRTIEPEILEDFYDIIPLFSPEGYHYFLPAYLIHSLNTFSRNDQTFIEFTIYAVTPSKKDMRSTLGEYWKGKFENFSFEQLNCIYDFLDLVGDDGGYEEFVGDVNGGRKMLKNFIEPTLKK